MEKTAAFFVKDVQSWPFDDENRPTKNAVRGKYRTGNPAAAFDLRNGLAIYYFIPFFILLAEADTHPEERDTAFRMQPENGNGCTLHQPVINMSFFEIWKVLQTGNGEVIFRFRAFYHQTIKRKGKNHAAMQPSFQHRLYHHSDIAPEA